MTDKTDKDVEAPANEVPVVPRDARADALALLSEDERAALEIELDDEQPGGDDDDDGQGDQPPAAAAPAPAADAPAPAAPAAPVAPAAAADEQGGDAGALATQPPAASAPVAAPVGYQLPDDFADQREALDAKFSDLDERLDAGDITSNEYARELRALTREEAKLDAMQTHADLAEEARKRTAEAQQKAESDDWQAAAGVLAAEVAADKIEGEPDYANDEKAGYQLGLQANAIMVSRGMDPAVALSRNEKVDLLRQARRELYYRATGKTLPAPGGADATAAKKAAADKRRVDVSGITPPVSSLPGAGGSDGEEAEFSAVMELEGEAFDNAVANMRARSPEKYARFMATT